MTREESGGSIIGGFVVILLITGPINALLYAKTASILWDWFLLNEYGNGPSTSAWFGIAAMVGLLQIKKNIEITGALLAQGFISILLAGFTCGLMLLTTAVTKFILGW